ncbi:MAG: recombinase family protein [Desulfotalea sp.]
MAKTVNYIRVSSVDQNEDRQTDNLPKANKVFLEKASGSSADRPQLKAMLDYIREGDTIHIYSIDRLARNLIDLNKIVLQIKELGAAIKFQKENLIFGAGDSEALSDLLFNFLGSFAQFELSLIKERQAEGIASAKAKGKNFGDQLSLPMNNKKKLKKKEE